MRNDLRRCESTESERRGRERADEREWKWSDKEDCGENRRESLGNRAVVFNLRSRATYRVHRGRGGERSYIAHKSKRARTTFTYSSARANAPVKRFCIDVFSLHYSSYRSVYTYTDEAHTHTAFCYTYTYICELQRSETRFLLRFFLWYFFFFLLFL